MKQKYKNLPDADASEAYIIEEYIQATKLHPDKVLQITRQLKDTEIKSCLTIMALVGALIRNGHAD